MFWCKNNEICVFFGVKKSGISVFLVSVENGAGVNKMTNMTYAVIVHQFQLLPGFISSFYFMED